MDKIKDLIYEVSDLLLGLAILVIITFTVGWQLSGCLKPIQAKDAFSSKVSTSKVEKSDDNISKKDAKILVEEVHTFKINSGDTGEKIAQNLKSLGLISSPSEFLSTLKKLNLESAMKAGSYKIKNTDSIEDIIHILTK